jgi:threonylcarbamoyladenosine tRNA methylthiotransferase CDKAL1
VTETSHDGRYYVGHNEHYEQILVPKREELMGKLFPVKIVHVSKFSMIGKDSVEDQGIFCSPES